MIQAIAIVLTFLVALGCSQEAKQTVSGPGGTANPNPKPVTSDKLTNVTDTSLCVETGKPPSGPEGSWAADFTRGEVQMRQVFTVRGNHTVMNKLTCTHGAKSVTVIAQAAAVVTPVSIQILSNGSDEKTFSDGKGVARCSISLKDGEVIEYSFQGPCLQLTSQIRNIVMVPAPDEKEISEQFEETP